MQSTLIRFTSSEYVDSFVDGNIYMSSLSYFWALDRDKLAYSDSLTEEEKEEYEKEHPSDRQDYSEGVVAQIPRNEVSCLPETISEHVVHDVRFRLNSYKYVNVCCFFRIDADESAYGLMDVENSAWLLSHKGINITADELRKMPDVKALMLVKSKIDHNPVLSPAMIHAVQLPTIDMNKFGDTVIVIKDQQEFERRVISAVRKNGGNVVLGDIRYHPMLDRVDPRNLNRPCATVISSAKTCGSGDDYLSKGAYHLSSFDGSDHVLWRGCLDKYNDFASHKEWRICWLPDVRNYEAKILNIGSLKDIVDTVPTDDIRDYFLNKYRGYIPGIISKERKDTNGTISYQEFNDYIKTIDGHGDYIVDIG